MTKTKSKKLPVPTFSSYEEEANFWDTHDTTDYDFRPVKATVSKSLGQMVSVRFESDTLNKIDQVASSKGLGTASLIRMWTMERLQTV
jgi:predicted DNA binding CopG/RHH family protein